MHWPWRGVAAAISLAAGLAAHPVPPSGLDRAVLALDQGGWSQALAQLRDASPTATDTQACDLLEGLLLHRLKRDGEAVVPLGRALARDPGDLEAAIDLGSAWQAGGRWDEARSVFETARARHGTRPEPWLGLGQIAAGQGQWAEALRCFQKAAELDPGLPAAWLGLSDAWVAQGDLRKAAESRDKALDLGDGDSELQFKQAMAWYVLGELDRSEKALRLAGMGDSPEAFFLAGCLAHRRGRYQEAERDYLAAIESKGDDPQARLNLGITYYAEGRYDDAVAEFDHLLQSGDDDQVAGYRADSLAAEADHALREGCQALLNGDLPAAMGLLEKSASAAPEKDKGNLQRLIRSVRGQQGPLAMRLDGQARLALAAANLPQAVLLWQEALSIDPGCVGATQGLDGVKGDLRALKDAYAQAAMAAEESGDQPRAANLSVDLAALDEAAGKDLGRRLLEERRRRCQARLGAGMEAMGQGQPGAAVAQFEAALALDPGDRRAQALHLQAVEALHGLVAVLLAKATELEVQGRVGDAYRSAQLALAADPGDLEARQSSNRLAARLNLNRDDAKRADDLYYQGVYAYGAGDTDKALHLWNEGLRLEPGDGPLLEAARSADIKVRTLAALERH
jgi:tetratricopeptide (TPR) repeat protein